MYNPVKHPDITTFAPRRRAVDAAPIMAAKPVYYYSDGTGRDSYIMYVVKTPFTFIVRRMAG